MPNRIYVGYWPHGMDAAEQAISSAMDPSFLDTDEWRAVMWFCFHPEAITQWRGSDSCRVCDKDRIGSKCYHRGDFVWPEGYPHYLEHHGVKPPQAFIDAALALWA